MLGVMGHEGTASTSCSQPMRHSFALKAQSCRFVRQETCCRSLSGMHFEHTLDQRQRFPRELAVIDIEVDRSTDHFLHALIISMIKLRYCAWRRPKPGTVRPASVTTWLPLHSEESPGTTRAACCTARPGSPSELIPPYRSLPTYRSWTCLCAKP